MKSLCKVTNFYPYYTSYYKNLTRKRHAKTKFRKKFCNIKNKALTLQLEK